MATLKDVARETGLTVGTVSRVLNNRGYISEQTRQNVYEAMKRLNYQPNEIARGLSKRTTNTIGVIVPHIRHPYFADLISNLENEARKAEHKILLFNSQAKEEKEWECMEMCAASRVCGIILCSGNVGVEEFKGLNVPLITIERNLENGTAMVSCDNELGGRLATLHLLGQGCRRLVHISGVAETAMPADDRAKGFLEECERAGIKGTVVATSSFDYTQMEYRRLLEKTLMENTDADGIFASSDIIAAQLLQICHEKGTKVPEELKIIGFDDVGIAALTSPPITTIHQPIKEMAREAVSLLVRAGKGELVPSRTTLPVYLIKRGTA